MLASEVITRVRTLIGDQDADALTDNEILAELNAVCLEVSNELRCYVLEDQIPVREDANIYDFPDDFIALKQMNLDDSLAGKVVLSSTYKDILSSGVATTPSNSDLAVYFGFVVPDSTTTPIHFRDTVSANQFHIIPAIQADGNIYIGGTVYYGV